MSRQRDLAHCDRKLRPIYGIKNESLHIDCFVTKLEFPPLPRLPRQWMLQEGVARDRKIAQKDQRLAVC